MSAVPMRCAKCGKECFSQYNLMTAAAGNPASSEMTPLCEEHAPWPSPSSVTESLRAELAQERSRRVSAEEVVAACESADACNKSPEYIYGAVNRHRAKYPKDPA